MSSPEKTVECTIPILPVVNLRRSVDFYVGVLRFKVDWGDADGDEICSVSRDDCPIMLQVRPEASGDSPTWVWVGVEHAGVFDEWRERGAEVRQMPRNFSWAYEMKFNDPDGNVIWVGTEPRSDRAFEDAAGNGVNEKGNVSFSAQELLCYSIY